MFGISRQSSGFWIAVATAFALGYLAALLPWNAEAQTGNCRSAVSSDVDNDVPPIVGMGNQSTDDIAPSDSETQQSSQ
jgi:hypothetical protein